MNKIIRLGSTELILPLFYNSLKRKKLTKNFPNDFLFYLQGISEINKQRNLKVIEQINFISNLFFQNDIKYVFLKGAALLLQKPYNVISDRMIGDIDILVSEKNIIKANNILIKSGFNKQKSTEKLFSEKLIKKRHLKRLIHDDYIAAIELHQLALDPEYTDLLNPIEILDNRQKIDNKYFICSKYHMWKHAILNWQCNDLGFLHNNINFRTIYDVINLEDDLIRINLKDEVKEVIHFYCLSSVFFENNYVGFKLSKLLFQIQLSSSKFDKSLRFLLNLKNFLSISFIRLSLMIRNRHYTKTIISNPKEVFKKFLDIISR